MTKTSLISVQLLQPLPLTFETSSTDTHPRRRLLKRRRSRSPTYSQIPPFTHNLLRTLPTTHPTTTPVPPARSRRTRSPNHRPPLLTHHHLLLPQLLLHNHLPPHHAKNHKTQSPPRPPPRPIQILNHPPQSPQNPPTRSPTLYSETLQISGPLLRP